mmetsp:Transcript_15167/g.42166  ORF Transcript_15167/g.42166 Transcript_15167/m.42166 type:complete len:88 (+) Transcript_15167:69-332(+)
MCFIRLQLLSSHYRDIALRYDYTLPPSPSQIKPFYCYSRMYVDAISIIKEIISNFVSSIFHAFDHDTVQIASHEIYTGVHFCPSISW